MNAQQFNTRFNADLDAVKASEKITREKLRDMSRYMLEALHDYAPDIRPVNDLLNVLTPVNRKVAIEFFREFTGFTYDKKESRFTQKDKRKYEDDRNASAEFLEDPLNNIWTWANQNIEVDRVVKPFDPKEVEKAVEKQLKKARQQGVAGAEVDILLAVLEGGITPDVIAMALERMQERKEEFAENIAD